jgi:hypothetical protein
MNTVITLPNGEYRGITFNSVLLLEGEMFCSKLSTVKLTDYLTVTEKPVIRKCIFQRGENALSRIDKLLLEHYLQQCTLS